MNHIRFLVPVMYVLTRVTTVLAQGPLLPSDAPAPTMKSLDQIEPRTPIANLPFTITASGSYFITGNLTGTTSSAGIIIDADHVAIDLMGFTLQGLPDALDGIRVLNARNGITVRNGSVTGWGQEGIDLIHGGNGSGGLIEGVFVFGNTGAGLRANDHAVVARVTARYNGGTGISAGQNSVIRESTARENGSAGIAGSINNVIENNTAQGNGGNGITSGTGSTVAGNVSRANTGSGIFANSGSRVTGNTVTTNGASGIGVQSFSVVRDNTADANGYASATAAGISASLGHNRIENNTLTRNNIGLRATDSDNVVKDNIVKLSTLRNYEFGVRNQLDLLLSEIPATISWPALVRLAGPLTGGIGTNGITIAANDVTIDLQGHTLAGAPGSLSGIYARDVRNTTVRNGNVVNWGSAGVALVLNSFNGVVDSITVRSNGSTGIILSSQSIARNCEASDNGGRGISSGSGVDCRIESCSAYRNGDSGIYVEGQGVVVDCFSKGNGQDGFHVSLVSRSVLLSRCNATSNERNGFILTAYCTLIDSMATHNGGSGVFLDSGDNVVRGNQFSANDERGIYARGRRNRIEQNHVTANAVGIEAGSTNNVIVGNTCIGNATNFYVEAGNVCQVITPAKNTTLISGNTGGVSPGSTSPWVNFAY
jgi:parallel beta-helix repeat protein